MRAPLLALATALAACEPAPIAWDDAVPLSPELAAAPAVGFDSLDQLVAVEPPVVTPPVAPAQCTATVRTARDTNGDWYAAWWATRADSTADLVMARSADGGATWGAAIRVDTLDIARSGCRRLPPAIAASDGNVHVAYSMAAREGPGVFASHSMDRGTMFHTPVAVVYGERIGLTAIAARGNTVAVAFEDPNSTLDHIGLALSRTMAHLFQYRHTASPTAASARQPDVVLGNGRIAVMWTRVTNGSAQRMIRTGVVR